MSTPGDKLFEPLMQFLERQDGSALLAPVQAMLDRGLKDSHTARGMCADLDGKRFAAQLGSSGLGVNFLAEGERLIVQPGTGEEPDVLISGGPVSLQRLLGDDAEELIRNGQVNLKGDTDVATAFSRLFSHVRPDPEEELSKVIGDVAAHQVAEFARGTRDWLGKAGESVSRSTAEYLREESRDLVAPAEVEEFCAGVDEVTSGVERAEARLQQLKTDKD